MLHGFAQHNLRDRISQYETPQNSTVTSQDCGKAQTHAKQSQMMCLQYKVLKKKTTRTSEHRSAIFRRNNAKLQTLSAI